MKKSVLSGVVVCSLLVVSSSLAMAGGSRGGMVSAPGRNRGPQGISQVMGLAAESDALQLAPGGRVGKPGSKGTLPGGGETLPPPPTGSDADFSGLSQGQEVGNTYSAAGLIFSGATVLQRYNGSGNPNAGIVYSPQGRMVIGFETLTARAVRFHYVASVALTLTSYASANGTGTALSTRTLAATVSGSPFSNWVQIEEQLPVGAKSVVLTGTADRWGLDAFGVLTGCPAPASASDDCNGNGQSDACEIARGLVQDCNGNGRPDSCDMDGILLVSNAVQWRVQDGGNGHWYGVIPTEGGSWTAARSRAQQLGGYLATITSLDENQFVFNKAVAERTFGGDGTFLGEVGPFLGIRKDAGYFNAWVSGEPLSFTAWRAGEPNGGAGEPVLHYLGVGNAPAPLWNDTSDPNVGVRFAMVEWDATSPADCNGNGVLDSCEIASGALADCNGNGQPDSCELASTPPLPGAVQWRVEDGGNGHWYKLNVEYVDWNTAKARAEEAGGYLASVRSQAENEFVFELCGDPALWPDWSGPWLGGFQFVSDAGPTHGWGWVSGEPWDWAAWAPGEPNDGCWTDERAVSYIGRAQIWNDVSIWGGCTSIWGYVIEWNGSAAVDCNANGIPDSCDLANGTSMDRNSNGVPDECDPNPVLTLTSNAVACNAIGSAVTVEARLSGASQPVVAGQMLMQWDASKLSLSSVTSGDAPFNVVYSLNQSAGQVTVLASVAPGSSGEVVANKAMARLNFTVVGGSCDGSQTGVNFFSAGPLQTEFADGQGNGFAPVLVGSAGFVVDDGVPVLSNVPADRTVRPEAGDGGFAAVSLVAPVATDSCSPLTETATRSDGQPLSAAYPVGVTTVTWRAVDPCGNTATATTLVTVEPYNMMRVTVALPGAGYPASLTRSLVVETVGLTTGVWSVLQENRTFVSGSATFDWGLPIDTYACLSVEDPARSLRRRVEVTDAGAVWTATATLVLGDLIDDEVIDVLDWAAYVVRNPNTAHDLNGDGVTNAADGQFILDNFGAQGQGTCKSAFDGPPTAIESISVAELVQRGLPELAGADLNGDGWLDLADMGLAD